MITIRHFRPGDEPQLRAIFFSAVHELACRDYSTAQLDAWAPVAYDMPAWQERIRAIQPFVAEINGCPVGYADLQTSGYIDHFFVAGSHAGRGVGRALMAHIFQEARQRGIALLSADVSLTAEPFFASNGFSVITRQQVLVRGVALSNALMEKKQQLLT
ncbi:GNAT family N-acetyltransferase [Pollutimonas bauzanensis]|uniref:GNAT family N-acetyltransferase n=1 Tax=Pollutimonas bauzanensis TaxID=658167 RepID=UPI00334229FB